MQALRHNDYDAFAASQLAEREAVGLPPYSHLVVLRVEARNVAAAQAYLADATAQSTEILHEHPGQDFITVYPFVPAPVARVADLDRWQMLVESSSRPALQAFLKDWSPRLQTLRDAHRAVVRWALDVDPLGL